MFQILNKKIFLVDYLGHFVDIHSHILPGIDDGAKDISDSLDIINGFNEILRIYWTKNLLPQFAINFC